MFKAIARTVIIVWVVGMIAAAIAALGAKRRLGPDSAESADDIAVSAIFGPLTFHSTSTAFRGGTVELWFGGGVLDLRDAVLDPAGAVISVRAILGGAEILVPTDWVVVAATRGLGGLQDVRGGRDADLDGPTLTIEGLLVASGLMIQSEPGADDAEWLDKMRSEADANV